MLLLSVFLYRNVHYLPKSLDKRVLSGGELTEKRLITCEKTKEVLRESTRERDAIVVCSCELSCVRGRSSSLIPDAYSVGHNWTFVWFPGFLCFSGSDVEETSVSPARHDDSSRRHYRPRKWRYS